MVAPQQTLRIGPLLRDWRQRRRLSQLELALIANISARHLSFIETGRAQPSRDMVLRLAEHLDVPVRARNALLVAAGHAPAYSETPLDAPEMHDVRVAIDTILAGHEPYPALVMDESWTLVASNTGMTALLDGISPELLKPPINVMRLALHPDGAATRIVNLAQWREHLLARLHRQIVASGSEALKKLYDEVVAYGAPVDDHPAFPSAADLVIPMRIRQGDAELSFFSTIATFGTPMDITLTELAIESFFPADEPTRRAFAGAVR
ncbi:helix-turn-helix domain-containing protein [Fodinicola acaciae]|uniref:helix-turn-helix domain-containing protein n=1 Tax=Fodinicola acaciae TaxID=2681555 RepID=UPI0013D8DB09|nr:helix-turn-helix transcriptional regulator [Fodinicola acaciae]